MNAIQVTCAITGKTFSKDDCVLCETIRPSLFAYLKEHFPNLSLHDWVSDEALTEWKANYIEHILNEEVGEISDLEKEVVESWREHELIATSPEEVEMDDKLTFGEKLADIIADFGGSWTFIISFMAFLFLWMAVNTIIIKSHPPDPFPYIFLNLILSCIAALQAPLIMMSQNRQEDRDRKHAEQDYKVNLKAELGIRHLNEKVDHLMQHHGQRLAELQLMLKEMNDQVIAMGEKYK